MRTSCIFFVASVWMGCAAALGDPSKTIVENALATPSLSSLVSVLTAPGYEPVLEALSGPGSFTVFAPNNKAFAAAGLNATDVELVTAVLKYHVLGSEVRAGDLKPLQFAESIMTNKKYVTLGGSGQVLDIHSSSDGVFIYFRNARATVVLADVLCSNGVVHVVDQVILLPLLTSTTASLTKLSTLVSAVVKAALVELVDTTDSVTIFAPTNRAFSSIGGIDSLTKDQLTKILAYHVVPSANYSPDLSNGAVKTLEGGDVDITVDGNKILVNDALVIMPNIVVQNGVIHVIDRVLSVPE